MGVCRMTNFEYLGLKNEYALFASAAIEAEKVYNTSPAMCAVGCRKALELAVKWVYAADNTLSMPYKDNLQALIHEPSFRFALDAQTWGKLPFIIKLGNLSVHTERSISASDALLSMKALFEFIQWIEYCYAVDYEDRSFDENALPKEKVIVDTKKIKEQESLISIKDAEIESLRKKIESMSAQFTAEKQQEKDNRNFVAEDISEYETRKIYIDVDMKQMGWILDGNDADVIKEYPVFDMMGILGQKGFVDYVLMGRDGLPLAVVEAKRTSKDPNVGRKQAVLYADCLERKFGRRPMMFTTNGFQTFFWDDKSSPQRQVSGIFSKNDLQKLMDRRTSKLALETIPISKEISGRPYQMAAIKAVCDNLKQGNRKNLLVMATGTGKTRTAASLTDVLSRGKHITNILFLADRKALVKQAKDDFKTHLPNMSLCNLCTDKDDKDARIVFSTYPTILNAIDEVKTKDGQKMFTPAHFDLIIIDESHRSIFKKYRAIFEYFDAILVGLTATPKTDVDRNTYEFFEMPNSVPTYVYEYDTAVNQDHVLVPYYNYEVKTKFLEEGINYDELSQEDKERYEEDFEFFFDPDEDTKFVPSSKLNKFVFNEKTVDTVLQDLMDRGIKVSGGDLIGKTIIFAQTKRHAEYILERFNKLYPQYNGSFAQRVICDDAYAQTIIDDFKVVDKMPQIVVSVDMMDTGIDVPECLNLVFFKRVRSKAKFWQMIGRGTRLAPDLVCRDEVDGEYIGKKRFIIFDYCSNFEFFRAHQQGYEGHEAKTLTESIYEKQVRLIQTFQDSMFEAAEFQNWRAELVDVCHGQVVALNPDQFVVKLRLEYVERYKNKDNFKLLNDITVGELIKQIAPMVYNVEKDELAKQFDNFMYGLMLANINGLKTFNTAKNKLKRVGLALEKAVSIPQVKAKLPLIKEINTDEYWDANDLLLFEKTRKELRDLIQFIVTGPKNPVFTNLDDPITGIGEGDPIGTGDDFEDYKMKVNRYVEEHKNSTMAIYKLQRNLPLTVGDFEELERVFTSELGSKEDYEREFGDTPLGIMVRKIAKLDHEATMAVFADFINDESLNSTQIEFVRKIINHIELNGYIDNIGATLQKPPFDRPTKFMFLFEPKQRDELIARIKSFKDNAIQALA